jgi:hypothetical protein
VELYYEPFREGIDRVVGSDEGECTGHFRSERGWQMARCGASRRRRSVGFILRKKKAGWGPCGSERRGRLGWPGGRGPMGRGRAVRLGRKGGGHG